MALKIQQRPWTPIIQLHQNTDNAQADHRHMCLGAKVSRSLRGPRPKWEPHGGDQRPLRQRARPWRTGATWEAESGVVLSSPPSALAQEGDGGEMSAAAGRVSRPPWRGTVLPENGWCGAKGGGGEGRPRSSGAAHTRAQVAPVPQRLPPGTCLPVTAVRSPRAGSHVGPRADTPGAPPRLLAA